MDRRADQIWCDETCQGTEDAPLGGADDLVGDVGWEAIPERAVDELGVALIYR